jgi:galactokinase
VLSSRDAPLQAHVALGGGAAPEGWARHVWGVVRTLQAEGVVVHGVRGTIRSRIPVGAGLSSSAALEVAVAMAVTHGARPAPEVLARAEQLATGVPCGVMDQATVLNGRAGHALLLDCSTGAIDYVPIPAAIGFVVVDTGTRRELADGRYATRRAEVEAAFALAGLSSLDDADPGDVSDPRLRHAVTEQLRVRAAADALRAGDVGSLGAIVEASQSSLRDNFDVSSRALDLACEVARTTPACHGARLVGAGFAGCAIAVVEGGTETDVAGAISERLRARLPRALALGVHAVDAAGES